MTSSIPRSRRYVNRETDMSTKYQFLTLVAIIVVVVVVMVVAG